jgi:hypothetical protein
MMIINNFMINSTFGRSVAHHLCIPAAAAAAKH